MVSKYANILAVIFEASSRRPAHGAIDLERKRFSIEVTHRSTLTGQDMHPIQSSDPTSSSPIGGERETSLLPYLLAVAVATVLGSAVFLTHVDQQMQKLSAALERPIAAAIGDDAATLVAACRQVVAKSDR
jgi:hypothetical protein